jgi:hypothetical protein
MEVPVRFKREAIDTQEYSRPCLHSRGYLKVLNIYTKKREYLHRVIWEELNGPILGDLTIDHINGNKVDNRIENLQLLTHKANCQRQIKGSVTLLKNGRWRAKRGDTHVGMFGTKCGALMAARMADL